jgi:hypothetical protein
MTVEADCLYLFETTHQAMWAEEVARETGLPVEVVPAPTAARAKCGLALRTRGVHCRSLEAAMAGEGIEFRAYEA